MLLLWPAESFISPAALEEGWPDGGNQLEPDLLIAFLHRVGGDNFEGLGNYDVGVQLIGRQSKSNNEDELPDGMGGSFTLEQEG